MDIEKSRNGFYTVTFFNKNHLEEKDIFKEFSTVGRVCKVVQNFNRVFIRYKAKEEAERALKKFGKIYDLDMAKNRNSDSHHSEAGYNQSHNFYYNQNQKLVNNSTPPSLVALEASGSFRSMEKLESTNEFFHLILGNLPKNYTSEDIKSLVEEVKPVYIHNLDETRVFHVRFCHIVLDSVENLNYLIKKLNGFMICGEKLIAAEARHLLEWKEKTV